MSDEIIFREVDEELRRDRVQTAWRRYGPFVIGACVAIIAIVAAEEGWSWWQGSNAARSSDQFYAALDAENNGDIPGAMKALDAVIAQGSGQYPVLARFKEAGLLAKQGKADDALKAFDDLATTVSNTRFKELALLSGANLLVDKGDVPGVKQRVTGLLASDNPLRNSARETLGLAQYKSGDLAGALDSFEAILNDPISSQETRGRIQVYIGQLAAEEKETAEGDHISVENPAQSFVGEAEVRLYRGQGHANDRCIEDDGELRRAEERERLPAPRVEG